jgi:sugar phosphate permease
LRQTIRYRQLRAIAYALGAMAFILAFFHRVAPGAIAADLRTTFGTSATTLGFIAAFYFYPYAAMQLPSGVLADSIGPRRLFTAGSVVAGIGSLVFAIAPDVAWLLAGRALVGLGVAVAFISVLKLIASWYSEREFATWVGVLQLVGNLGGTLGAYPLAWLVQHVSWRAVFAGAGVASLIIAACIWLWVRDTPREAGLQSPGEAPADAVGPVRGRWTAGLARVAANGQTWLAFTALFGLIGSYLTFSGLWAVPYLTDGRGMDRADATLHVTVMILGFAFGAPVAGSLSDRIGRRLPPLRILSILYLACWVPWVMEWSMPLWASTAVFGLMGIGISGGVTCWALAKEHNPPALSGTATSLVNSGGFLAVALLQPAVGWIIDHSAGVPAPEAYRGAVVLLAAVALTGVLAAFLLRETYCRNVSAASRAQAGPTKPI